MVQEFTKSSKKFHLASTFSKKIYELENHASVITKLFVLKYSPIMEKQLIVADKILTRKLTFNWQDTRESTRSILGQLGSKLEASLVSFRSREKFVEVFLGDIARFEPRLKFIRWLAVTTNYRFAT